MDNQLETMQSTNITEMDITEMDITEIDPMSLTEIDTTNTDTSLPDAQKTENYTEDSIENTKNPYCFLCGDIPVNIRFTSNKKTLEQSLSDYFISLK